jgi:hypothetical protein
MIAFTFLSWYHCSVTGDLRFNLIFLLHSIAVSGSKHLPVFSFLIRHGARFLHHNYVCALLNDLFGVQSRGERSTVPTVIEATATV